MLELLLEYRQFQKIGEAQAKAQSAHDKVMGVNDRINALERRIESLVLYAQAIAEILEEKVGVSEEEILSKIEEIDLRDGLKDGKISVGGGFKCEKCNRGYNSRINKCLYCGHVKSGKTSIVK